MMPAPPLRLFRAAHPALDDLDWTVSAGGGSASDPLYVDATVLADRGLLLSKDARWATCALWMLPRPVAPGTDVADKPRVANANGRPSYEDDEEATAVPAAQEVGTDSSLELLVDLLDGVFSLTSYGCLPRYPSFIALPLKGDQQPQAHRGHVLSSGVGAVRVTSLDDGSTVDSISKDDCPVGVCQVVAIAATGFKVASLGREEADFCPTAVFAVSGPTPMGVSTVSYGERTELANEVGDADQEQDDEDEQCFSPLGTIVLRSNHEVVHADAAGPFVFCFEPCTAGKGHSTLLAFSPTREPNPPSQTTLAPTSPRHSVALPVISVPSGNDQMRTSLTATASVASDDGYGTLLFLAVEQWDMSSAQYPCTVHALRIGNAAHGGTPTLLWSASAALGPGEVACLAADAARRRVVTVARHTQRLVVLDMDSGEHLLHGPAATSGESGGVGRNNDNSGVSFSPPTDWGEESADATLAADGRFVVVATTPTQSLHKSGGGRVLVFPVDSALTLQRLDTLAPGFRELILPEELGSGEIRLFSDKGAVVTRLAFAIGDRNVSIASFAVFIFGTCLASAAPSLVALCVFRAVQAAGAAGVIAVSVGVCTYRVPGHLRAVAINGLGSAMALGTILGQIVGAQLTNSIGWRFVFVIVIPMALIGAPAIFMLTDN
ncbi:hypothetical protein HK405_012295, partial [Cladochytrium tenue]